VSQYATREDFARSVRQQIVSTARDMLEGRLSFLLGSRVLAPLRPQSEATRYDQDFLCSLRFTRKPKHYHLMPLVSNGINMP
jgi:hypothetical protein